MSTKPKSAKVVLEKILGPFDFAMFMRGTRTSMGLTQVQMAKLLGLSKSTLCDIEKGRQFVSPALAAKIARRCGVSEIHAVHTVLNDQLRRAGLKMRVEVSGNKSA